MDQFSKIAVFKKDLFSNTQPAVIIVSLYVPTLGKVLKLADPTYLKKRPT